MKTGSGRQLRHPVPQYNFLLEMHNIRTSRAPTPLKVGPFQSDPHPGSFLIDKTRKIKYFSAFLPFPTSYFSPLLSLLPSFFFSITLNPLHFSSPHILPVSFPPYCLASPGLLGFPGPTEDPGFRIRTLVPNPVST